MKNIALVIGRFQLPHKGHFHLFEQALANNDHLIIAIGSYKSSRSIRNPFSHDLIKGIINEYFNHDPRIHFVDVEDYLYLDEVWANELTKAVVRKSISITEDANIILYGHEKDASSYYLKMFPYWKYVDIDPIHKPDGGIYNATDFRNKLYEELEIADIIGKVGFESVKEFMPAKLITSLSLYFRDTVDNHNLDWAIEEFNFVKNYKRKFANMEFKPTFITGDALCVANNHILLIERKNFPCKGAYALVGGFLDQDETIENCIVRELYEETKIDISIAELKSCLKKIEVFDIPNRSMRGRTVTHAGLFILPDTIKVVANDDASAAFWFPLDKLEDIRENMMEDHAHIIRKLLRNVSL